MSKKLLGVFVALAAHAGAADASDMIKGCFERVYDKAHMASHAGQMASAIQLQIGIAASMKGNQEGEEDQDLLTMRDVAKGELYFGATQCRGTDLEASCINTENAERFSVTRTKTGIKLNVQTPLTLLIEGTFDRKLIIPKDAENEVWALIKISEGNCGGLGSK
jgi:hypothetical protein